MKKPNPAFVILTALWRIGIAVCAFAGWWLYGHDPEELPFLTQSGNLLVAIVFLGLAFYYPIASFATGREPGRGKLRGMMTLLLVIVGGTYVGVMEGDLEELHNLLTHVVTPLLVLLDWCFIGRSQNRARWWHPFIWILVPAVWMIGYTLTDGYEWVRGGSPLYSFLNPERSSFPMVALGMVVAGLVAGFLLYGIAKIKNALSRAVRGPEQPEQPQRPPNPYPQQLPQQQWGGPPQQPGPYQPVPQQGYPPAPQQPLPQQPVPQQPGPYPPGPPQQGY
ncbi:Pr6Pr family membrane protein [Microlunatus parietis]|uniref:Integral membrane protein n=1 Tax=Microlunatus parietis TaxID=682979 RepID=A0A7Y9LF10_9ACTN|nr:Pr6Pr family membrane protein [Microlunatus parietis]NYE73606.1 hypothetical protein [Microlunatus parietis]